MITVTSNFFRGSLVMMVFLMFFPLVMYSGSGCGDISFSNCCNGNCQNSNCLDPHAAGKTSCDDSGCLEVSASCSIGVNCYFCITDESYNDGDKSQWVACPGSKTDCSENSDKKNMTDIKNKIKIRKKSEQ